MKQGTSKTLHYAFQWKVGNEPDWQPIEDAVIEIMDNRLEPQFYFLDYGDSSKGVLISSVKKMPFKDQLETWTTLINEKEVTNVQD